jgi:hypothetical protein
MIFRALAVFFVHGFLAFTLCAQTRVAGGSAPTAGGGTDIRVDPVSGDDANDGRTKAVKTIKRAIRLALPGDTVHLATALYHESADLSGKKGEAGRPITLDGHGSVLDGSEPVRAADWEALGNGLYRRVKLMPRMDNAANQSAVIMRWFFLWDGTMNHMGRTSKGPSAPLKKPADLQPGEWTYAKVEDAFYVRIPPNQNLDAAHLRYPARSSGVIESGGGQHLVVRNTISTHVYNDGYNIHGSERDCVFENIASIECGDDGFSAHEDAECFIDGYVSIGNSTGLCDTVSSSTHYKNLFIKGCLGYDVYFIGDSPHSIENGLVISSAASACSIGQHTDRPQHGPSAVLLKDVLFRRTGGPQEIRVSRGAKLTVEHCTFENLKVQITPGGELAAERCVFTGEPKPEAMLWPNALWLCDHNVYDFAGVRVDKATFTEKTFADFQKLTGGDKASRWGAMAVDAKEAGADEASLKGLEERAAAVVRQFEALDPRK